MAHFFFFNVKVMLVVAVGFHYNRHPAGNGNAVAGKPRALGGIIGNQADAGQPYW